MANDSKDVNDALLALGIGPETKELYVDLLRPAAKELSGNLLLVAKAISLAMLPLRGLIWGFDAVQEWLLAALLKRLAMQRQKRYRHHRYI